MIYSVNGLMKISFDFFTEAVHVATKIFSVQGKIGLVIGSISPWVEIMCLRNGAKKVIFIIIDNLIVTFDNAQSAIKI